MSSTPLWVPLLVGAMGIAGVWLTQRRADKREDKAWEREQEREQARCAREDSARTYEARREAYLTFFNTASDYGYSVVMDVLQQITGQALGEGLGKGPSGGTLVVKLNDVKIYGSPRVIECAEEVQSKAMAYKRDAESRDWETAAESCRKWLDALTTLLNAIREDLGVPSDGQSNVRLGLPDLRLWVPDLSVLEGERPDDDVTPRDDRCEYMSERQSRRRRR